NAFQFAQMILILFSDIASHHWFKQFEEATKFRTREQSDLCSAWDGFKKKTSVGLRRSCRFSPKRDFLICLVFCDFELRCSSLARQFEVALIGCAYTRGSRS